MFEVKAVRAHNNDYGEKRDKEVGDTYTVANQNDAEMLQGFGLVEIVSHGDADGFFGGQASGSGADAAGDSSDSKKRK
jgi:hypothetical protein